MRAFLATPQWPSQLFKAPYRVMDACKLMSCSAASVLSMPAQGFTCCGSSALGAVAGLWWSSCLGGPASSWQPH